jgi:hypothetical protein
MMGFSIRRGGVMKKILLLGCAILSMGVSAQTVEKPNPNSPINAVEQIHGLPGGSKGTAYSVKTKKKVNETPSNIVPMENTTPANCADSMGGKGGASFTACEAQKK